MRQLLRAISIVALLLSVATIGLCQNSPSLPQLKPTTIVAANNTFGINLLAKLYGSSQSSSTIFISPTSISQSLGLLYIGTAGKTHDEIGSALSVSMLKQQAFVEANAALLTSLNSDDNSVQLTVANAIWSQKGLPFGNDFREQSSDDFSAPTKTVDFTDSTVAASEINHWVADNTKNKITDLVSPQSISNAALVLTNAVYFKGKWVDNFNPDLTKPAPFYSSDTQTYSMLAMFRNGTIDSYFDPNVTVIRLPYNGSPALSMIVAMPTGESIGSLVSSLSGSSFDRWMTNLIPREVALYLPKFNIDYSTDLTMPLKAMGIKLAFSPAADLSPMGISNASVSSVVHKSTLSVDEQGTVATAATGDIVRSLAMPVPRTVHIDHPFVCAIRDDTNGELLFVGIVTVPTRPN